MTRPQFLDYVRLAIKSKGGIERASGSWDIQVGNLQAVQDGRIQPGPRLQKALGITQLAGGDWVVTRKFAGEN